MHRPLFVALLWLGLAAAADAKGRMAWHRPGAPVAIDEGDSIVVADGYIWNRVPGYGSVWIKDARSPHLEISLVHYNTGRASPDRVLQALRDKHDAAAKSAAAAKRDPAAKSSKDVKFTPVNTQTFRSGTTCHFYISSEKGGATSLLFGELLLSNGNNYTLKGRISADDKGLAPWMAMLATVVAHVPGPGARTRADEQGVPANPAKAIPMLR